MSAERPAFQLLHGRRPNQRLYHIRESILGKLEKSNEIKAAPKIAEIPLFLASEMAMSLISNDIFQGAELRIDLHDVKAGRTVRM